MGLGTNRIVKSVSNGKSLFPNAFNLISAATSWNAGDLLIRDSVTKLLRPFATGDTEAAQGQLFCGIAPQTVIAGKLQSPYVTDVDASQGIAAPNGPQYDVVAHLALNTGDTINPGDPVFLIPGLGAASAFTVTTSAGAHAVGVYQGPLITGAAAGTFINVLLGAQYPNATLKF